LFVNIKKKKKKMCVFRSSEEEIESNKQTNKERKKEGRKKGNRIEWPRLARIQLTSPDVCDTIIIRSDAYYFSSYIET